MCPICNDTKLVDADRGVAEPCWGRCGYCGECDGHSVDCAGLQASDAAADLGDLDRKESA